MVWETQAEVILRLKAMAAKKDVTGYYAARILYDVRCTCSLYGELTPAQAAQELGEARQLDQGKFLELLGS
jgi:hypothetical protein